MPTITRKIELHLCTDGLTDEQQKANLCGNSIVMTHLTDKELKKQMADKKAFYD